MGKRLRTIPFAKDAAQVYKRYMGWGKRTADEWARIDWGEQIIIVMIGLEILLSVTTILLTVYEAKGQDALLGNIATEQSKVDTSLTTIGGELRKLDQSMSQTATAVGASAATSNHMNAALQSQLRILAQEQKQRLAELAKKPEIHATVNGVQLDIPNQAVSAKEITSTKAVYEIVLTNTGSLSLVGGLLRIGSDNPKVIVTVPDSIPLPTPTEWSNNGQVVLLPLSRLGKGVWTLVTVTAAYPEGTPLFHLDIVLDGDNLALTPLAVLTVTPPL